jgi:hypothetical protein
MVIRGGDPDLFVYKGDGRRVRFFVEVKHNDKLNTNQEVVFPLIEKLLGCPVKLVRIYRQPTVPKKLSAKATGLAGRLGSGANLASLPRQMA